MWFDASMIHMAKLAPTPGTLEPNCCIRISTSPQVMGRFLRPQSTCNYILYYSRYCVPLIGHLFGLSKGLKICLTSDHFTSRSSIRVLLGPPLFTHLHSHFIGTFSRPRNRLPGQQNQWGNGMNAVGCHCWSQMCNLQNLERFLCSRFKMV